MGDIKFFRVKLAENGNVTIIDFMASAFSKEAVLEYVGKFYSDCNIISITEEV